MQTYSIEFLTREARQDAQSYHVLKQQFQHTMPILPCPNARKTQSMPIMPPTLPASQLLPFPTYLPTYHTICAPYNTRRALILSYIPVTVMKPSLVRAVVLHVVRLNMVLYVILCCLLHRAVYCIRGRCSGVGLRDSWLARGQGQWAGKQKAKGGVEGRGVRYRRV